MIPSLVLRNGGKHRDSEEEEKILNVEGVKVRCLSAVHNVAQHVVQRAFL